MSLYIARYLSCSCTKVSNKLNRKNASGSWALSNPHVHHFDQAMSSPLLVSFPGVVCCLNRCTLSAGNPCTMPVLRLRMDFPIIFSPVTFQ